MECDGERALCPDLVGASVIEHRVTDHRRSQECYRIVSAIEGIEACMELNLTKGTCVIWFPLSPSKETRLHERNHCRGWGHTSRTIGGKVFYSWSPFAELDGLLDPTADGSGEEGSGS